MKEKKKGKQKRVWEDEKKTYIVFIVKVGGPDVLRLLLAQLDCAGAADQETSAPLGGPVPACMVETRSSFLSFFYLFLGSGWMIKLQSSMSKHIPVSDVFPSLSLPLSVCLRSIICCLSVRGVAASALKSRPKVFSPAARDGSETTITTIMVNNNDIN